MDDLVISYNSSTKIDNDNVYTFYYYGKTFKVIGDKAFSRGDILKITNTFVDEIYVEVLGDPQYDDNIPDEISKNYPNLPTLVFAITKVPLSDSSNYVMIPNQSVIYDDSVEKDMNKWYFIIVKVLDKCKVKFEEESTGNSFEWSIRSSIVSD